MATSDSAAQSRDRLDRLAHVGLDSFAYRERALRDLRRTLAFDAAWWWTIDPASGLFTSGVFEPTPTDHVICGGLHANEFGDADYNKFRVLARRPGRVATLHAATAGEPERSERYRRMLVPLGYEHELRVALGDEDTLWGGVALLREPGAPDFAPAESRRAAALVPALTEGLRIGVALGAATVDCTPNGPGMLLVDDDLGISTMTANAERWLDELTDGAPGLPDAVRSVIGSVAWRHDDAPADDRVPRVRVRGASGRWLTIHASRTRAPGGRASQTAVIIEQSTPAEIAPLIIDAYGLTAREARVTRLVLQGLATKQIAAEIHLSPYTVQDHLKAIFAKVGVRSRRELVARIYDHHHRPRFGLGEHPPEADGAIAGGHAGR